MIEMQVAVDDPADAPVINAGVDKRAVEWPPHGSVVRIDLGISAAEAGVEKQHTVAEVDGVAKARLNARPAGDALLTGPYKITEVDPSDVPNRRHAANPTTGHPRVIMTAVGRPYDSGSRVAVHTEVV